MEPFTTLLLAWIFIGGFVGYIIGSQRGRAGEGAIMGAVLGIIGWFLLLAGPDGRPKCRSCKGTVPEGATKCMHCGESLAKTVPVFEPIKLPQTILDQPQVYRAKMNCPHCNSEMLIPWSHLKYDVVCPTCTKDFKPLPDDHPLAQ